MENKKPKEHIEKLTISCYDRLKSLESVPGFQFHDVSILLTFLGRISMLIHFYYIEINDEVLQLFQELKFIYHLHQII